VTIEAKPNIRDRLTLAVQARDALGELAARANVHTNEAAVIGFGLCLTIQELFAAVILLMDQGLGSHAPTLARPALEALADLRILAKDHKYLEQLKFDDARENLKLFKGYSEIKGMPQDAIDTLQDWSAKAQPTVDAGKATGLKKQQISDKMKLAGLEEEYVTYGVLCGFSHNQLTTITARHGKHELRFLHEPPYETMNGVLGLALSITGKAIQQLPAFSDLPEADIAKVVAEIDAAWG